MKKILLVFSIFCLSIPSLAQFSSQNIYLKRCKTHGTQQDARIFTRCMNSNFRTIDYELENERLNRCPTAYSMSQRVVNCHKSNFSKIEFILNLRLRHCQNFGSEVSVSYEYCVNDNFRAIEGAFR
ncbi:MAG: hypothetical protein MK008_01660 [Bdellovibrionales bacterium]|nr:hypothetical protein [Bdellovibrionales bacterium]